MAGVYPDVKLALPQLDWKYEMRRECQEVLTGIWVGPSDGGRNLENLKSIGITAIAILRSPNEALFIKPRYPDQFKYLVLDVNERADQNLITIYPTLRDFIDTNLAAGGKVLIHDDGGMSRAPAMAAMYVIDKCTIDFERAMTVIQYRRYCIHLNQGFIRQLMEFEAMCVARQQHLEHQQAQGGTTAPAPFLKRNFTHEESEELVPRQDRQKRGRGDDDDDDAMQE